MSPRDSPRINARMSKRSLNLAEVGAVWVEQLQFGCFLTSKVAPIIIVAVPNM